MFRLGILAGIALTIPTVADAESKTYSKAVQQSCKGDYKAYAASTGSRAMLCTIA
jgi:hypothetical protein